MTQQQYTNFYPSLKVMPLSYGESINHDSINERLAQASNHINSLSYDLYTAIRNSPQYLGKFLEHNSDPFYMKEIDVRNSESFVFNDFFNIDGTRNQYLGWKTFSFPDISIVNKSSVNMIMFYKLDSSDETVHISEKCYNCEVKVNTLKVYINPTLFTLPEQCKVFVLIFKHVQDFGPHVYSEYAVVDNFQKLVEINVNTDVDTVWTERYLKTFVQYPGSTSYQQLPEFYSENTFTNNEGKLAMRVARYGNLDVEQGKFMVLNTLEPFYYSGNLKRSGSSVTFIPYDTGLGFNSFADSTTELRGLNTNTTFSICIPLLKKIVGSTKIPVSYKSSKDFHVFINGIKLIAEEDYFIGQSAAYGSFIQVTKNFGTATATTGINITVIKNIPFVAPNQYSILTEFDKYGIAEATRIIGMLNKYSCVSFCNRKFCDPTTIKYILDDRSNFSYVTRPLIEINSYFIVDDTIADIIEFYLNNKLEFEHILDFLDQTDYEKALQNWIDKNNLPEIIFKPVDVYPSAVLPTIVSIESPGWVMEGIISTVKITAANATGIKWVYDGGAAVELTNTTSWTVNIKPLDDKKLRYVFLRAYIYGTNGVSISDRIQLNVFPVNLDPTVPANILPNSIARGSSFNVDVRTATETDGSTINGFNIFVNNGAVVTNKTQFTCTVVTTAVVAAKVNVILEIFDKEYSDTFLPGLPYGGLGYDCQVGATNSIGGEDGFITIQKDVLMT